MHWAKEYKSKFDIEGKPIPGNSKQETPQVPFNKNRGQIPTFPSNPTSGSAAMDIPALNDFLIYPQAVPSRTYWTFWAHVHTGGSESFGLSLGQSSLT